MPLKQQKQLLTFNNIIIKYQKKLNLSETKDDASGTYNTNSQIKLKNLILKWNLWDHSDAYIFIKRTITITGEVANDIANKKTKEIKDWYLNIMRYSLIAWAK